MPVRWHLAKGTAMDRWWPVERINTVLNDSRWLAVRLINLGEDEIASMRNTTARPDAAASVRYMSC